MLDKLSDFEFGLDYDYNNLSLNDDNLWCLWWVYKSVEHVRIYIIMNEIRHREEFEHKFPKSIIPVCNVATFGLGIWKI